MTFKTTTQDLPVVTEITLLEPGTSTPRPRRRSAPAPRVRKKP
jgi:hypothetical protein